MDGELAPGAGALVLTATLAAGAWTVRAVDLALGRRIAGASGTGGTALGCRGALRALRQARSRTEKPDELLGAVAPAAYVGLAAVALAVVPFGERIVVWDSHAGIVLFGAAEALVIVAVFLRGWAPNSPFALIGGYRFVAQGLTYGLLSMFVLIAAAIPAQSLRMADVVASQTHLWNVVRQPLGLPLWLVVSLGVTFRGPLAAPVGADLAGGTEAEASPADRLLWETARAAMLAVFALMGATVFLGGWRGPWLPGPLWLAAKALGLLFLLSWLAQSIGRLPAERFVVIGWTVLLPAAFVHLLIAGLVAL